MAKAERDVDFATRDGKKVAIKKGTELALASVAFAHSPQMGGCRAGKVRGACGSCSDPSKQEAA